MGKPVSRWGYAAGQKTKEYKIAVAALTALGDSDLQLQAFADATATMRADEWVRSRGVTQNADSMWWGELVNGGVSDAEISDATLPGDDHTSLWDIDGKPAVYVSQPYGLSLAQLKQICAACDQHGLTVEVGAWPAWHFPGSVLHVEYRKAT